MAIWNATSKSVTLSGEEMVAFATFLLRLVGDEDGMVSDLDSLYTTIKPDSWSLDLENKKVMFVCTDESTVRETEISFPLHYVSDD